MVVVAPAVVCGSIMSRWKCVCGGAGGVCVCTYVLMYVSVASLMLHGCVWEWEGEGIRGRTTVHWGVWD